MKVTQRAAVFSAIVAAFTKYSIDFVEGMDVTPVLTKDMRSEVHALVFGGFREGTVEFEDTPANAEKLASDAKLNSYVSGLISNWIRKDKRLNGNISYVPKNPGSRAGQDDDQLRTLRKLKVQFAGQPQERLIDGEITKRVSELQSMKAQATKLTPEQIASLPADLISQLGLEQEA